MTKAVGIDFGQSSIHVTHVLQGKRELGFEVVGYDTIQLELDELGRPLSGATLKALQALKARGSLEGDTHVVGLSGEDITIKQLTFPYRDEKKIEQTIAFELADQISFDIEDVVYSWKLTHVQLLDDGAERATVDVAVVKKEAIENVLSVCHAVELEPRLIEPSSTVLSHLYQTLSRHHISTPPIESGEAPAVLMLDIGATTSDVCLLGSRRILAAHTIRRGGRDMTMAIAKALGRSFIEVERQKSQHAFIEVADRLGSIPEEKVTSDAIKGALDPLVKRLRQIVHKAHRTHHVNIERLILTGGGSRVHNLEHYLQAELNVHVEPFKELRSWLSMVAPAAQTVADAEAQGYFPQAAQSVAYAVSGLGLDNHFPTFNLRQGDYAWKGSLEFMRERAPALGLWLLSLFVLFMGIGITKNRVLVKRHEDAKAQFQTLCQNITGAPDLSPQTCLDSLREKIDGTTGFQFPRTSAVDIYLDVAKAVPEDKEGEKRKVKEIVISQENFRLKGTVEQVELVESIFNNLNQVRCLTELEKDKTRKLADGYEFAISAKIDCLAKPGDIEYETVGSKPPPRARSAKASPKRPERKSVKKPALTKRTKPRKSLREKKNIADLKNRMPYEDDVNSKSGPPSGPRRPGDDVKSKLKAIRNPMIGSALTPDIISNPALVDMPEGDEEETEEVDEEVDAEDPSEEAADGDKGEEE